ncbi:MAG: DUF3368 domain-containing protein [Desulfamplus sp.]
MGKVMVNSSPVIGLSMINQMELLWKLFDEVMVPEGVFNEIAASAGKNDYGKSELETAVKENKLRIYTVKDKVLVGKLIGKLHQGEVEVIVGGREESVDFVVIDEITARNLAEAFSLTPIGTVGILRLAKRERLIENIKYYLDELKKKNFRIADKIYFEILKKEGEDSHQ